MDKEQADAEPLEELEPPSKRTCIRYSREQKSVLEQEFELGATITNVNINLFKVVHVKVTLLVTTGLSISIYI